MRKKIQQEIIEEELELEEEKASRDWIMIVFGIFCLLSAIVFVVSCLFGDDITQLTNVKLFVGYLFGRCMLALPLALVIIGFSILSDGEYEFFNKKNLGLLLVIVALCGIVHCNRVPFDKIIYPSELANGGGLIGGLILLPLTKYFDSNVIMIALSALLFVGILFVIPYYDLLKGIFYPFKLIYKRIAKCKNADFDEETDENEFEDEYIDEDREQARTHNKHFEYHKDYKTSEAVNMSSPVSVRDIIAKHTKRNPQAESVVDNNDNNSVSDFYKRDKFKQYSDGIRKESFLKRVVPFGSDNVYDQKEVKSALRGNSVNVPPWMEAETKPNSARTIFGASMYNNPQAEDEKIIPLHSPQKSSEEDKGQSLIIKHYRENEADDIIAVEKEKEQFSNNSKRSAIRRNYYKLPKASLLNKPRHISSVSYEKDIQEQCDVLEQTLKDFRVHANVIGVTRGPSVTRFEIEPAPGVKVSSVTNLADDIALKLATSGVRIEAPIPGKAAIGIEVPNIKTDQVFMREIIEDKVFENKPSPLCVGLGKDINGEVIAMSIDKMPHLLIAGSTGSGKSVCINSIIANILFKARPDEVKFILIDPKVVELSNYNDIPHLLTPVVTDMKKAASALHWAVKEMEHRYSLFAENKVREINSYNNIAEEKLPYIVVVIDELSDLMMVARIDVEDAILRLAQKARAAGIHLILATQRPSVDVITGIIKANIPSRIAFAVSSQTDSRTILDVSGAEKLIGHGDMLYFPIGVNKPVRVQGVFVSDDELNRVLEFITSQNMNVEYVDDITTQKLSSDRKDESCNTTEIDDDLFPDVLRLVMDTGQASASMFQRRFRIGYTRAARLVDTLEEVGIIGQATGSKPRELIMSLDEINNKFFNS